MYRFFFLLFFIPIVRPAFAQTPGSGNYENTLRNGLMGFEYRNGAEKYKGDQYFNAWSGGVVNLENGDVISKITIRYDKYMDELLWLRETDFKAGVLAKGSIRGFTISGTQKEPSAEFFRKKIKLPYKADSSEIFLQLLVKGDVQLYAWRRVIEPANDFNLRDDTRYLLFDRDKSCFVGGRRRQLVKIPCIDEARLKRVLKSSRIHLDGTEGSLIKVIDLYNSSK
jgi:hypothetical protein